MGRMLTRMLLAACLALGVPAAAMADVRPPPPGAEVDYQLGGAYRLPEGVRVVVRDRTDPPARSGYSICYVNAYQTQPGTLRWWRRHHPRLLLRDILGVLVHDPGWRAEVLLDTSTPDRRRELAGVVGRWIDGCAESGYRAVEPDNLDSFTRARPAHPGRRTRRRPPARCTRAFGRAGDRAEEPGLGQPHGATANRVRLRGGRGVRGVARVRSVRTRVRAACDRD
jgi:hypothetical protein